MTQNQLSRRDLLKMTAAGAVAAALPAALTAQDKKEPLFKISLAEWSLHKALFIEPSPAPTKWAMAKLGRCNAGLRLPITPLTAAGQVVVENAMREAALL